MKNTDTREVIMISIRLSTKNLQTDYYPFILEPEARHLFLKELASHFTARTDLLDIQQHLDEILLTLDGRQTESYTFALTLPRLISITLDTCNACGKSAVVSQLVCLYRNGCRSFPPYTPFHLRHDPTHHSMDRPSC